MLTQVMEGPLDDLGRVALRIYLGRPNEGTAGTTGLDPIWAVVDRSHPMLRLPRGIATKLMVGFRDTGEAPELEDTAKVAYGFFDPGRIQYLSVCVAQIVPVEANHVLIGSDMASIGELTVAGDAGTWRWTLPHPVTDG